MYDPMIGRWLSPDPSGFAAGDYNLYRYVRNDPTNAIDPSGLDASYKDGTKRKMVSADMIAGIDLTGMPTDDYLKSLQVDKITTAKKFEESVRNIMSLIVQSRQYKAEFESLKQFVNYAKYLAWVTVFAQQLQQIKPGFPKGKVASFPGSEEWEENKAIPVVIKAQESKVTGVVLKRDVKPSDGIKDFFGKDGNKSLLDCASFVSIVSRRALLEVLGASLYDEKYNGVGVAGLHVKNDPFPFAKTPLGILGLIPGMSLRYKYGNEGDSRTGGVFNIENTIFIGGLNLIGQPFEKPLNPREMKEAIEKKAGIAGTRLDIVSSIEFKQLPK